MNNPFSGRNRCSAVGHTQHSKTFLIRFMNEIKKERKASYKISIAKALLDPPHTHLFPASLSLYTYSQSPALYSSYEKMCVCVCT